MKLQDDDRILNPPLQLAVGSHAKGSGFGCAMNVISWEQGDFEISDTPACTALALAYLVQGVNDDLGVSRGKIVEHIRVLLARDSIELLDIAHQTVGTALGDEDRANGIMFQILVEMRSPSRLGISRSAKQQVLRLIEGKTASEIVAMADFNVQRVAAFLDAFPHRTTNQGRAADIAEEFRVSVPIGKVRLAKIVERYREIAELGPAIVPSDEEIANAVASMTDNKMSMPNRA